MLSILAAVVAAGMIAAPWIMRLLVSGVDDPAVAEAQVQLGTFLLWFFLPQILFYAASLVATAVLNATGHFALPVFAPTVNNIIVIGVYIVFALMRGGAPPSLDLTTPEKLVLAVGTTLGVVAFTLVPVIGARRVGYPIRPRLDLHHPVLRRLARQGLWAAGFLAVTQILLVVVLYLSNGVEGGVVVYQLAFVLFMLPNSLFAVPVFTTAFPALTRYAHGAEWQGFGDEVARATRSIALFTVASAVALAALAVPLSQLVALGNASGRSAEVAGAIAGFAVGLPGFSMLLFLTRVSYAYGNTRTPTLANAAAGVIGTVALFGLVAVAPRADRITVIGVGYGLAQTVGAVLLAVAVRSRVHEEGAVVPRVGIPLARTVVAAALAGAAAYLLVRSVDATGTVGEVLSLVAGAAVVAGVTLAAMWALGGPSPTRTLRSLGGDPGRPGVT